ncbi:MAG: substrate-binding domain-containing protein [Thermodesulfobacteriota bacterium]
MNRRFVAAALFLAALLLSPPLAGATEPQAIILATTSSTQDSGLLDLLTPIFEAEAGITVKTIAVGSGQAMAMGEKGEADVLLVHSPEAEKRFMEAGFGANRRLVMHNDFVLVGPAADPAGIRGSATAALALSKIATTGALFMSRGDKSGTHAKEQKLWKEAGLSPAGAWYQETGLGMGQTLSVASEKGGYTLADRGTYLAARKNLALEILVEGEKGLLNVYHVIELEGSRFPKVNVAGGKAFADFMVAPATQEMIRTFGVDRFGSPLFFPDAGKKVEELGR